MLVSRQNDANGLKRLVAKLKAMAPKVTEDHLKVHRPWGSIQALEDGERYQVKRLVVRSGERLSLQMHHHRSEHWIVVRGTARVTLNEAEKIVHDELMKAGHESSLNDPYVGGYVTEYVDQFRTNNIQIEINRRIYMDEKTKLLVPEKVVTLKPTLTDVLIRGFEHFDS